MNSTLFIIIGVIATLVACVSLPYGFYLKSQEDKADTTPKMEQSVKDSPGASAYQAGRDIK